MREQTTGVENAGVSPMDSQPENTCKLRWRYIDPNLLSNL